MATYQVGGLIGIRNYAQFGYGNTFGQGNISQPGLTNSAQAASSVTGSLSTAGPSEWLNPTLPSGFSPGTQMTSADFNPNRTNSINTSNQSNSATNSGSSSSSKTGKGKKKQRNTEPNKRAKAQFKDNPDLSKPWKPDDRVKGLTKDDGEMFLGIGDLNKEGSSSSNTGGGFPLDDIPPLLQGAMRDLSSQISSMEQLLSQIPDNILGQFINNLPGPLQSFLPPGLIPGLTNSGPFNLNSLLQLAGGGSLGNAAGQVLRSLIPGIPLTTAVQQLAQIFPQAGNSTSTSAAGIANALSSVQQIAGVASNSGIPISANTLNQAFSVALQASGLAQQIPANISGLAGGITNNPLGSVLNAVMGGMGGTIPVLPSIMSSGFNSAMLSGLGQSLPADIAKNLFSPNQLQNMLPGNLQNIIPQVAPIFSQGFENAISSIANAAPQMSPNSNQPGGGNGGSGCKHADPSNDGKKCKDLRHIDYTDMLSETFSIFHLTTGSGVAAGRYPLQGDDVDKIVKNLSGLAENVLEPLKANYPGFTVMSGYRDEGEHKEGKCVDVGWSCSPAKLQEIASWIQKSLPVKEVQLNWQKIGWLHIKYEQGGCGSSAQTNNPNGGVTSGLVNNVQSGLSALA